MESIFSTTWAEVARDTESANGKTLIQRGHTVDNQFRFSNSLVRFGFERMAPPNDLTTQLGFQFGLGVYSIRYRLNQTDQVRDSSRVQHERWMQWTPSIGFKMRSAGYEIRYALSMTCGAGGQCMPSCPFACGEDVVVAAPNSGGVIAAPTEALRFNGGRVTTQRLTITLRIR